VVEPKLLNRTINLDTFVVFRVSTAIMTNGPGTPPKDLFCWWRWDQAEFWMQAGVKPWIGRHLVQAATHHHGASRAYTAHRLGVCLTAVVLPVDLVNNPSAPTTPSE
jgi:hypothetical protein